MAEACREDDAADNPGLLLGAVLGTAATSGRDKCTIVCSPEVGSLGTWLEQLLAESTGKEGRGIIPVAEEPPAAPDGYREDRLFVHIRTPDGAQDEAIDGLRRAGHPVLTIDIAGPQDLGAEFFRWEVATAIAGGIIGINPFDQPNVQESKDNTKAALERFRATRDFGVTLSDDPGAEVSSLFGQIAAGDYFAMLAYTAMGDEVHAMLQQLRAAVLERHAVATTLGYGPRYLHSTGQLHKGGPNSGVYLILSDAAGDELPIPEAGYGFKTLIHAQWMGDLKSLRDHGRRVAHMPLGDDVVEGLREVISLVEQVPAAH
jgi:glucose-6-phosphate isomerase/transaldolase/glucose-6-phosphate isomerase